MGNQITYSDITETNEVHYNQQGWTATRKFVLDGVDMSDPASTTANALQLNVVPARGDDHPSGLDMQADDIFGRALSSTQIEVTVTYKKLSAAEAEADESQPALMTIGSTVQEDTVASDAKGNPLVAPYTVTNGTPFWAIYDQNGNQITNPTCAVQAKVQFPNTILRFQRREPNEPSAKVKTYVGRTNASVCQWGELSADVGTLLCTRIEGNTQDGGVTYIVEYEFQYNPDTWAMFAQYTLPNNCSARTIDGSPGALGPGDPPTDADTIELDIYDTAEFNNLSLV